MSRSTNKAERRSLVVQQLIFSIGIIINLMLMIAQIRKNPDIRSSTVHQHNNVVPLRIIPSFPPRSLPPLDSPKWLPIIIVCGTGETNTVREMEPLLKSAMLLSSAPLHFIFITDQGSSNRIQRIFQEQLQYSKKPLRVDTFILKEESVNTFSSILDYNPTFHHSGVWGTSKLMLPWIVRHVDKALMIDTDMIFLDDPARVWSEFEDTDDTTNNDNESSSSWLYKMPLHNPGAPHGICSCIVLLKLAKIRQSNTFPTLMQEGLASRPEWKGEDGSSIYDTPNGDQGLYWAMLTKDTTSHIIAPLPERWNVDRCNDYFGILKPTDNSNSQRAASVMHNNCNRGPGWGGANEYFLFYHKYKWHWLSGGKGSSLSDFYKVNVTVHSEETSRLKDLFNCLKKNGNYTLCKP